MIRCSFCISLVIADLHKAGDTHAATAQLIPQYPVDLDRVKLFVLNLSSWITIVHKSIKIFTS